MDTYTTTKLLAHTAVLMTFITVVVTQRVLGHFAGFPTSGQFHPRLINNMQKYTRQRRGLYPNIQTPLRFGQSSGQRYRQVLTNPFSGSTNLRSNNGPSVLYNYERRPIRGNVRPVQPNYLRPIATPTIQNGHPRRRANFDGRLIRVTPPFVANRYYTAQHLRVPSLAPGFQPQRQRVVQTPVIPRPRAVQHLAELFQRPGNLQASYAAPRYVQPPPIPAVARPESVIKPNNRLFGGYGSRGILNTDGTRQNIRDYTGQVPPGYQGQLSPWQHVDRRRYSSVGNVVEEDECTYIPDVYCRDKAAGHYAHPASPNCFVQCDSFGRAFGKRCAGDAVWRSNSPEPAAYNLCS